MRVGYQKVIPSGMRVMAELACAVHSATLPGGAGPRPASGRA